MVAKCRRYLWTVNVIQIEYLNDGYMRREGLVTEMEADEIASRVVYDQQDVAHIAVTRTLYIGRSTVWFKVLRVRTSVPACAFLTLIDVEAIVRSNHAS